MNKTQLQHTSQFYCFNVTQRNLWCKCDKVLPGWVNTVYLTQSSKKQQTITYLLLIGKGLKLPFEFFHLSSKMFVVIESNWLQALTQPFPKPLSFYISNLFVKMVKAKMIPRVLHSTNTFCEIHLSVDELYSHNTNLTKLVG